MIRLNVLGAPREAILSAAPGEHHARPLLIVEINETAGKATTVAQPLPGFVCEQCLDAPAVVLVPAPWGGEMGVCDQCHQASAVAALPALAAHEGQQTIWHTIHDPERLVAYRATAASPLPVWWDRCVSTAPARVCVCGSYRLIWGEEDAV